MDTRVRAQFGDAEPMRSIPPALHGRPFTVAEARLHGISERMLYGARFQRVFRGVYRTQESQPDLPLLLRAAFLLLPADAAVSHLTCLRLMGFAIGSVLPLHFSTNLTNHAPDSALVLHRRQGELHTRMTAGFRTLGPMRTFVDVATNLSDKALARVGDWMLAEKLVTLELLRDYLWDSHLDGVQRARRVLPLLRAGVASPRESDLRWELRSAGLPEPELNTDVFDAHGAWLAKGDLVFRAWKIIVEYDGWQHERDARQRQWDILRREALEAAGWRLIVITTADMSRPGLVVARVRQALAQRGYRP
jgi:hypothetical protein